MNNKLYSPDGMTDGCTARYGARDQNSNITSSPFGTRNTGHATTTRRLYRNPHLFMYRRLPSRARLPIAAGIINVRVMIVVIDLLHVHVVF